MDFLSQSDATRGENVDSRTSEESYRLDYGRPMGSKTAGHPFEMCIARIPPGKRHTAFHAHMTQWEFYYVLEGSGQMRLANESVAISAGDAMMCKPGEAHQPVNDGDRDLVLQIIATNQPFDACVYPDAGTWGLIGEATPSDHRRKAFRLVETKID